MLKNITNGTILVATEKGNVSLKPQETIEASKVLNADRLLQIHFVEKFDGEAERKAKEEAERLEAERKAKEEAERLEAERKAKEEAIANKPKAPTKSK